MVDGKLLAACADARRGIGRSPCWGDARLFEPRPAAPLPIDEPKAAPYGHEALLQHAKPFGWRKAVHEAIFGKR